MVRDVPEPIFRFPLNVMLAEEVEAPVPTNAMSLSTQLVVAANFPLPLVLKELVIVKTPEALFKVPPF